MLTKVDRFIMAMPIVLLWGFGVTSVVLLLSGQWLIGGILAAVWLVLLLLFLRNIPAAPPEVGLVTIWGKRKLKIKEEGWRLFAPFFPFFFDAITVSVEAKNKDFQPKDIRTKDRAELAAEISITYTPGNTDPAATEEDRARYLITYINKGGKEGVDNILDDTVEEGVREIAAGTDTWMKLVAAKKEITVSLIAEITGITDPVKLEHIKATLKAGNGLVPIPSLGITLNRFNLGKIVPLGELAKVADRQAVEEAERAGETVERDFLVESINKLVGAGVKSAETAAELFQVERGKVNKNVQVNRVEVDASSEASRAAEALGRGMTNMGGRLPFFRSKRGGGPRGPQQPPKP